MPSTSPDASLHSPNLTALKPSPQVSPELGVTLQLVRAEAFMGQDGVAAFRRPVAPCPSCGEAQHIEPLRRVGPVWYLRCLSCQFGLRMRVSAVTKFRERRLRPERRATVRGGHRIGDTPLAHQCHHCGNASTRAWVVTPEAIWLRCEQCGRIERFDAAVRFEPDAGRDLLQSDAWYAATPGGRGLRNPTKS